jgi:HSP20 family protein
MDFDRQFYAMRRHIDDVFNTFHQQAFLASPFTPFTPLLTDDLNGPFLLTSAQEQSQAGADKAGSKEVPVNTGGNALTANTNQSLQPLHTPSSNVLSRWASQPMKVDVIQDKDTYTVVAEVPGMQKHELKVQVHDDTLTISGERKQEVREENNDQKYVRMERSYGHVSRSLRLPKGCDTQHVNASHDNGVLKVTIPFRAELTNKREIAIA